MYVLTTLAGKKLDAGTLDKCYDKLIHKFLFQEDVMLWWLVGDRAVRHSFVSEGALHKLLPGA